MTDKFALYMMRLGKAQNTMETYTRNVRQYFEWCEFSFGNAPPQLYRANVLEYISYMRNLKGYSPKFVNDHLSTLRCLNEFLIDEGIQTETVILKTDFMKVQLQYASPCTVEKRDVDAFRQRLLESGSKRDYAIVTLYAYSGLRRTECVNLLLEQVDLVSKEIRVVGKGDKQRLVYINDKIVHAIREYLKERRSESPYLFISRQSGKLAPSRINQIFNQYSDCITPKTLRHYFRGQRAKQPRLRGYLATAARDEFFEFVCSHALESGYSIHGIANQAGHSNVQTTLIYSNPTAYQGTNFTIKIGELVNKIGGLAYQMSELSSAINTLVSEYGKLDQGINGYTEAVAKIVASYSQITDGAAQLVTGSSALKIGSESLYSGTGELLSGIVEIYDGTGTLKDGTGTLDDGVAELLSGIAQLYDGAGELKDGTSTMREETAGMDTEITDKIDELIETVTGGDFEVTSFVSDKNTNVQSVQFVIKADGVQTEEVSEVMEEAPKKLTVWQKFLDLFGLYHE